MISEKQLQAQLEREQFFEEKLHECLEQHCDANETAFLERELTHQRAKVHEVKFPELMAKRLMPLAGDVAPSAETWSAPVLRPVGKAKHGTYEAKDIPRADVVADEILGKVRPITMGYGWNVNELKEAARVGRAIPQMKAMSCRKAIERGVDETLAFGAMEDVAGNRPDIGMDGFVNNALVEANGIEALPFILDGDLTGAEVVEMLSTFCSNITNNTKRVFNVNTLALPGPIFEYCKRTAYSDSIADSILTVFKKNNEGIDVIPWWVLDDAGDSGKPRAIAYQKDAEVLEGIVPLEYEEIPPQSVGFEIVTNAHARCGGTKIYHPEAVVYGDFATS